MTRAIAGSDGRGFADEAAGGRVNVLTGRRESFWFHMSRVLNAALGGDPRMTFSARSHLRRVTATTATGAALWRVIACGIDLGCALLYGESEHCGCAWEKHRLTQGETVAPPAAGMDGDEDLTLVA